MHEERALRPFIGPAGGVLEECLHAAGLIRSEIYVTNVFKHRIKKVSGKIYTQRGVLLYTDSKGFTEDAGEDIEALKEELATLGANVLVPMGNPALRAITNLPGITKRRGSIYKYHNAKVVPTIHPAATLQSGNFFYRYYIIFDLRRAKEEGASSKVTRFPKQTFGINPGYGEALKWLEMYHGWGKDGHRVNFDIEIIGYEIDCISFATGLQRAVSVPFRGKWNIQQETWLWRGVAKIIGDPDIAKANQNILFDAYVLAHKNRIFINGRLDDPMVANHIIYPDFPKGLDFLCSIHTPIPYYKDEGKVWRETKDKDTFYRYNCQDSAVSIECMNKLDEELDQQGYRDTYEQTLRVYRPLLAMMLGGIRTDREALVEVKEEVHKREKELQVDLNALAERELNVNSTKQLQQYFYVEKGIPPYLNRKTGRPTCDDKALARLAKGTTARPAYREASLIQQIRGLIKLRTTYLDISFDDDGRFRCSYNPRGTTSGRLSSSKTLFGTGMNNQNLPMEFKQFLVADPGYVLVELDKAQAEWIITAYASGDEYMIEAIEKGYDPHTRTGQLITGAEYDIIVSENKVVGHETNPDRIQELRQEFFPQLLASGLFVPRTMAIRQAGKKSNHGLNYGMGYKRFALENELEEREAKRMVEGYHQAYPGIRSRYYSGIQDQLGRDRTITNCFGRKRRFLGRWGPELFNQAYDFIPQSTVADLINIGMVDIYESNDPALKDVQLLAQVHDSILVQIPQKDTDLLSNALFTMGEVYLNPEMTYRGRTFKIKTDYKIGYNWRDMVEISSIPTVDKINAGIEKLNVQKNT